jgi:hypothetical protein
MIAVAAIRFRTTARSIDSRDEVPSTGSRIALAALMVLLGFSLFVYLTDAFVATV